MSASTASMTGMRLRDHHDMQAAIIFRKTKVCRFFMAGACKRPGFCNFAHAPEELKGPPDLHRTRMCQKFCSSGRCDQGGACSFAHSKAELRKMPQQAPAGRAAWPTSSPNDSAYKGRRAASACVPVATDVQEAPRVFKQVHAAAQPPVLPSGQEFPKYYEDTPPPEGLARLGRSEAPGGGQALASLGPALAEDGSTGTMSSFGNAGLRAGGRRQRVRSEEAWADLPMESLAPWADDEDSSTGTMGCFSDAGRLDSSRGSTEVGGSACVAFGEQNNKGRWADLPVEALPPWADEEDGSTGTMGCFSITGNQAWSRGSTEAGGSECAAFGEQSAKKRWADLLMEPPPPRADEEDVERRKSTFTCMAEAAGLAFTVKNTFIAFSAGEPGGDGMRRVRSTGSLSLLFF